MQNSTADQFFSVVMIDEAPYHVAVGRALRFSQADIQHIRFVVVIEPQVVGTQIQGLRDQPAAIAGLAEADITSAYALGHVQFSLSAYDDRLDDPLGAPRTRSYSILRL